jgi:hypothetical protein
VVRDAAAIVALLTRLGAPHSALVSAYDLTYRAVYGLMCRGCGVL